MVFKFVNKGAGMKGILLGFWLLVLTMHAAFAYELEILTLQHRSPEEILPIIRPLLDADAAASGMSDQLFLRTSPRNLAQIKQLLISLDTAPRRLKISVMQDVDRQTVARLNEFSGSVGNVRVPGSREREGVQLRDDNLNARFEQRDAQVQDHKTQQLQVIEGGQGYVRVGQTQAIPQRQVIPHPWGNEVVTTNNYQEVGSGFYVRPRLHGDEVTLEISTENDAIADDERHLRENIQHASSTLSGRLGEWLEMGGMSQQQDNQSDSLNSRDNSNSDEQRSIYIK